MTNTEPNVSPTGRYGITQAATLLGIDRSTLWRWCQDSKKGITPVSSKHNNRKVFKGKEILRLWRETI